MNSKKPTRETLYVLGALACMFVMIIVSSLGQAGLDPKKLFSTENLSNLLINAAITVFGMMVAIPLGTSATKQRINPDGTVGRYLQEFNAFYAARNKVGEKILHFSQWHHQHYLEELRKKQHNYLLQHNITQPTELLKLERTQIEQLTEPRMFQVEGEDVYFKSLSEEQIQHCLKVIDGKVNVHKLPDMYFLYIDGKYRRSFYDQAYYEQKDASTFAVTNVLFKVFVGFVITCIFTSLTFTSYSQEESTRSQVLKILLLIFTRLFNAVSSVLFGYLTGKSSAYRQCYYINGKTQILEAFLADKSFVYVDEQTLAKQEFLERSVADDERADYTDVPTSISTADYKEKS